MGYDLNISFILLIIWFLWCFLDYGTSWTDFNKYTKFRDPESNI